jgi:hypothetical protein
VTHIDGTYFPKVKWLQAGTCCWQHADMDANEARNGLREVHRSYEASVSPPLPRWAPPMCAVLVGGAVAVVGLGYPNVWWKLAAVAVGVLGALGARQLLTVLRARQGVRGMQGPARRTQVTVFASGAAYLIAAMEATPPFRWVFVTIGLMVGVIVWVSLRKQIRT